MKMENENDKNGFKPFVSLGDELRATLPQKIAKLGVEMAFGKNSPFKIIRDDKSRKKKTPALFLNSVGDLWREPVSKYLYGMGENSDRHSIIRYLSQSSGYHHASEISSALSGKGEKTIRTEIGKIRQKIKKFLNINGNDFLQGKKGSGYRINPECKINFKNP